MGNETRWRRPSVSLDAPSFQKGGLHLAHPGGDLEEAVGDRPVLCDCHLGPMYHFPVSLKCKDDFVMCWVSECGRCYNKALGYFHLRTSSPTLSRIDEDTRSMALCPNEHCPTCSSMAITRSADASGGEDKACWFCFDCGTEFPRRNVRGLWERLLRSFRPSSYQRLSAKR
jgi:DNA-directed RNA polymerase subunit M/transcription elongation factor TFIIS